MRNVMTVGRCLCLLSCCAALADEPAAGPIDLDTLRQLRREATARHRRIIFNNDGDDVIYTRKEPTPEALLALRTTPLLGSQVDSIFYSNSLCFGQALHNSRVFEPFICRAEMFADNALPDYLERGLDPIAVMADFCHRHGLEIFWDMRVNDTHDAGLTGYGPLLLPTLKKEHPEYLVGAPDRQPPHGPWSSVNYAVPEVRELAYRFFEEVCQRFDIDGIELDFMRHCCFFKSVAWGAEATDEERDAMTELLRRTRAMTEREGCRRGRPILLAIRVPDSVEYCRAVGLDLERWLAEGLVDILVGSCYFQLNPWEYLVELGHRYHVAVYPSLSESRVRGESRFHRNSLESYRARAAAAWAAGVDGIYIFNYFNPRAALWRELGDPATLAHLDKLYFATPRNGSPNSYLAGGSRYFRVPILTPANPWLLPDEGGAEIDLPVGDDLAAARQAGLAPQVTCHVRALGTHDIRVTVNDQACGAPTAVDDWLDFPVPAHAVTEGHNTVRIAVAARDPAGPEDWTVTYQGDQAPAAPWQKEGFHTDGLVAVVQDGALLIADRSTEAGGYAYFRYPCFISPTAETVVEVRMKVISGWSSLILENGEFYDELMFYPDRIKGRYSGVTHEMDTTADFHTYRFVLRGRDYRVFVDDAEALDAPGGLVRPAVHGRSGVMFGAANSGELGEALWQSVKVRNPVVTLLDVALSITYAAATQGG